MTAADVTDVSLPVPDTIVTDIVTVTPDVPETADIVVEVLPDTVVVCEAALPVVTVPETAAVAVGDTVPGADGVVTAGVSG